MMKKIMRAVLTIGIFIIFNMSLMAQTDSVLLAKLKSVGLKTDSKSINRYTRALSWGLVGYSDRFVADETEITVAEWLEFICYHDFENYPSYTSGRNMQITTTSAEEQSWLIAAKYDTTLLPIPQVLINSPIDFITKPGIEYTFLTMGGLHGTVLLLVPVDTLLNKEKRKRLVSYLNTPITGISYNQALAFCKWRTAVDSVLVKNDIEYLKSLAGNKSKLLWEYQHIRAFIYSLPTAAQFDLMNAGIDSLSKNNQATFNYRNAYRKNADLFGHGPVNVFEYVEPYYSRKNYKVTHIQGNVAEMISEQGIAKGGSYYHPAAESYPGNAITYTSPAPWLGFRCVGIKYEIEY